MRVNDVNRSGHGVTMMNGIHVVFPPKKERPVKGSYERTFNTQQHCFGFLYGEVPGRCRRFQSQAMLGDASLLALFLLTAAAVFYTVDPGFRVRFSP
jgi:hypothetical protein